MGGSAVKHPQVMRARIGTRAGELFDQCGGFTAPPRRVAVGSPLLGKQIIDLDEPVIKTTGAVFALLNDFRRESMVGCISCGECRTVCPVAIDPEEIYKKTLLKPAGTPAVAGAGECHGCGCCEVVCPSRLPLSTVIAGSCAASGSVAAGPFAAPGGD